MKIDLQIHSTHSDGNNTPQEIIRLAKECGLDVIAITDHDVVSGIKEAVQQGDKAGIKVIPAVEITTGYKNFPLHVLGYGINEKNEDLKIFLQNINRRRKEHFIKQIIRLNENLKQAGKQPADAQRYENKEPKYYRIFGIVLFLYEEGITDNKEEGFRYLEGILDVIPFTESKDAFAIIHKAGGKAFLSHPFAPKLSLKNISGEKTEQEKILSEFKQYGLDGIECYQAGHDSDDVEFCLQLAEKYDFLISAGSDWHGPLSQTGEHIKEYLPYYLNKLGDLSVPEEMAQKILAGILG